MRAPHRPTVFVIVWAGVIVWSLVWIGSALANRASAPQRQVPGAPVSAIDNDARRRIAELERDVKVLKLRINSTPASKTRVSHRR
jgi:hypothetical protein